MSIKYVFNPTTGNLDATDKVAFNGEVTAGSDTSPSIFFTGDTNTGIYSPGEDQVAISTNGTGKLFIDSAGKVTVKGVGTAAFVVEGTAPDDSLFIQGSTGYVGLGTSSPSSQLHCTGDIKFGDAITLSRSISTGLVTIADATAEPYTQGFAFRTNETDEAYRFQNGDGTSTYLTIRGSGNVGVGTTAPGNKLEIRQDTAGSIIELVKLNNNAVIGSGKGVRLGFGLSDSPTASSRAYIEAVLDGNNKTYLAFANNNGSGVFERARLDGDGRLLVGTDTARSDFFTKAPDIQLERTADRARLMLCSNLNNLQSSELILSKTRGTTAGSATVVQQNDELGVLHFAGADGTDFAIGASIKANVDGTPAYASNDLVNGQTYRIVTVTSSDWSAINGPNPASVGDTFTASGGAAGLGTAILNAGNMPGRLVFSTTADGASSPTERMRITKGGVTGFVSDAGSTPVIISSRDTAGTTVKAFSIRYGTSAILSGTESLLVYTNGDVKNTNGIYTSLTSDERFKQDIVELGSQWDDIKGIGLKKFRYKNNPTGELQLGVIAQELQQVCPGLVTTRIATEEDVDASGGLVAEGDEVFGWKMSILPLKAVKALQEAMERIETLEAKVAALENA